MDDPFQKHRTPSTYFIGIIFNISIGLINGILLKKDYKFSILCFYKLLYSYLFDLELFSSLNFKVRYLQ